MAKDKNIPCRAPGCVKKFKSMDYMKGHMFQAHGISAKMIPSTSKAKLTKKTTIKKISTKNVIEEEPQSMEVQEESENIDVKEEPIGFEFED